MTTKIALNNIQDSAVTAITSVAAVPKITSISVTDNSYTVLDDTAVGTSGGYIKITGTGFTAGSQVLIGTVTASSVSFVGSTELRAQLPATAAGTYVVYVVATDGSVAIRVNGITFSSTPTWSTGSSLGTSGAAISIQLAAVSDTAITYSLAAGSTLPSGLSLSSSGLLSGTVTGVTVDTVYNFTVTATDVELQDSPRSFSITITVKDPYFPYVPLLLETGSALSLNTTVTDSSASPNTVTRVSNPSTGWVSPYQTDGYWGNYFGANGDSLTAGSSTTLALGAGDFTIETWVYLTSYNSNSSCVFDYRTNGGSPSNIPALFIGPSGILALYTNIPSGTLIIGSSAVPLNTWTHLAIVRSGTAASNVKMYLNGANIGSGTTTSTLGIETFAINNPALSPGNIYVLNGYISNFRIVKGVAVYTTGFTPSTNPLTATQSANINGNPSAAITGTQTSLLTCQSNRFKDNGTANSGSPFTITVNGTPQVTPYFYPSGFTAPAASPGAALFSGTSQFLKSTTATTAFQFGTSPYTVECWTYQTSRPARQYICGGLFSGTGFQIFMDSPGLIRCSATSVGDLPVATIAVPLNAWTHIAVVRTSTSAGGVVYYVNGAPAGANTMSADISGTASSINVGTSGDSSSEPTNGYIGNFRAVKGTAVYTGAFTPPSGPLTQTGGTYPSTTNVVTGFSAANTTLLLALSDSNYTSATNAVQNNTFIDSSNYAFTITRNGTPTQGSVTPYWPNGQWSNYFNGSSGYLSIADNAAFNFGTSNATVEFWFNSPSQNANNYPGIVSSVEYNVAGSASIRFDNLGYKGKVFMYVNGGGDPVIVSASTVAYGTWNHVAIVRESTTFKLYLNGTLDATAIISGSLGWYFSASGLRVGRGYDVDTTTAYYLGYVSNLRLVKGVAVYTGAFTPPTSPLQRTQAGNGGTIQAITGTQTSLLTCQSNRFIDNGIANSGQPFAITVNGTPRVQAFQPFSPTASYTTALYGGSGYFNGSTDYLSLASNEAFNIFGRDMTIDGWLYPTALSGRSEHFLAFIVNDANRISLYFNGTTFTFWTSTTGGGNGPKITSASFPINTWTHVALVKSGATFTLYINGISAGTSTTTVYPTSAMSLNFGTYNGVTSADAFTGYMSNVRVVKGTAVYTGNFTPPTAPVTAITNTSLLTNFTNAGIYDAAVQNDITTVGTAQVATTPTSKWPPSSIYLNGSANYLTIPAGPQWLMSGDWTFEAWIYPTTVTGVQIIINTRNISAVTSPVMYLNGSNLVIDTGAAAVVSAGTIIINSWQYVAATRSGNAWKLFINGSQVGSTTTNTTSYSTAYGCAIGRSSAGENFNGYIQDVRVTNGVARTITASPTAAFQTK